MRKMEELFQDTLLCETKLLVTHSGESIDTLPVFHTLAEFDRGVPALDTTYAHYLLNVRFDDQRKEMQRLVKNHERLLAAGHRTYNMTNLTYGLLRLLKSQTREAVHNSIAAYVHRHGEVSSDEKAKECARVLSNAIVSSPVVWSTKIEAEVENNYICTEVERLRTHYICRRKSVTPRISCTIHTDGSLALSDISDEYNAALSLREGYDKVPVNVWIRMKGWRDFVTSLYSVYGKKQLYQPIDHPEFADWTVVRGNERIDLLESVISNLEGKKVLDVGSCLGHLSRWAYTKGAKVEGIEGHNIFYRAANHLNVMEGTDVKYYCDDIVRWVEERKGLSYDAIFCLSVIHNIAQQGRPDAALKTLRMLSTMAPVMYFEIGQDNEGGKVSGLGLGLTEQNLPRRFRGY